MGASRRSGAPTCSEALVGRRPDDDRAVGALNHERQHAVGEIRLDRVDRTGEQALVLIVGPGHVQRARLVAVDDLRTETVRGEDLGEIASDAAPRYFDLDHLGHPNLPYPC